MNTDGTWRPKIQKKQQCAWEGAYGNDRVSNAPAVFLAGRLHLIFFCSQICFCFDESFWVHFLNKKQKRRYPVEKLLKKLCLSLSLCLLLAAGAVITTPTDAQAIDSQWCCTVWKGEGGGNYAMKNGSSSSASLRVVGRYSKSHQARNAAQSYVNNGYYLIGPCRCDKAWNFHSWIQRRGNRYTSQQDLRSWNRSYNIKHYGTANP